MMKKQKPDLRNVSMQMPEMGILFFLPLCFFLENKHFWGFVSFHTTVALPCAFTFGACTRQKIFSPSDSTFFRLRVVAHASHLKQNLW
jgi:hypothetical protein